MKATTAPDGEGMERTDAPDEGEKKWILAAAATMTQRNGFGDGGDAAPRSKMDAPRGGAAATRVAAPDLHNLKL